MSPTPLTAADQIIAKIADLQQQLQVNAPGYESLLHQIHVALHKDEELVHLLTPEQVGTIVAGLSKKKNVVISAAIAKKSTNKKLSTLTLGVDL
jgi:hypothetical protein